VAIGETAIHVFDSVIKRCSSDYRHETLMSKWGTFQRLVAVPEAQGSEPALPS